MGERDLDGVGVLKKGKVELGVTAAAGAVGIEFEELFALALVVVAEPIVADGGRTAVGAIHHDVQARVGQTGHGDLIPLYVSGFYNLKVSGILRFDPQAAVS